MGSKDSKPIMPSYDDLIKKITDSELIRLKEAYKRSSAASGIMAKNVFEKEILEQNFPKKYMDKLYCLFEGTSKGISVKELITGIILITKGTQEEKIKVLYAIYENDSSQKIRKDEFLQTLNLVEREINFDPYELFKNGEEVDFDAFFIWTKFHENFSSLSSWLLIEMNPSCLTGNEPTMPTFYQTLAGITHLDENEIIILEKQYYQLKSVSKNDRFDFEIFQNLVMPPLPLSICQGLFRTFDENGDGHIDFKELACGISACCRGPAVERLKFCFKLFDEDSDGTLSKNEVVKMMTNLLILPRDSKKKKVPTATLR